MNVFQLAAVRLLVRDVVTVDITPVLEVEMVPQLTLAEMAIRISAEIGTRGLLQELQS